jgi:hypothetical protein
MRTALALLLAALSLSVAADDRADYNRRAADADMAAFRQLDLNGDSRLTQDEAQSDLNLGPRFHDIDINRDGVITPEEMRRYIERTYGVSPSA